MVLNESSSLVARKQCVNVNGHWLNRATLKSDKPQETVLGPTLFLLFVNDLPEGLDNGCCIFADDTTAYAIGFDLQTGAKALSSDLDNAYGWAYTWGMHFNAQKSDHLTIGPAAAREPGACAGIC